MANPPKLEDETSSPSTESTVPTSQLDAAPRPANPTAREASASFEVAAAATPPRPEVTDPPSSKPDAEPEAHPEASPFAEPRDGEAYPVDEPTLSFEALGLPDAMLAAVASMGWPAPTQVQAAAFGPISAGGDVLVQSQTGSGKTGAFCLPWLASRFEPGDAAETGVQLVVLTPTRELAKQVCDQLTQLAADSNVVPLPVYGGTAIRPQFDALRAGVHAVIGTPGRVLDHIRRRTLNLSHVRTVVLDEADEMLSMGFLEDIHAIMDACPRERQTALFSATVPTDIERIARRYMKQPASLKLSGDDIAAAQIEHAFYSVPGTMRTRDLLNVLAHEETGATLVFCNTREETNLVANVLRKEGFLAEPLSSELTQQARERVLASMRKGRLQFLVATDVASRGIDISHISHVVNYSFPQNAESYVHRTGRTGRAGKAGKAISLIGPHDMGNFYNLKLQYPSIQFEEAQLPATEELQARRRETKLDQISKRFPELVSAEWTVLARTLGADPRGEQVIAYLLSEAMSAPARHRPSQEQTEHADEVEPGRRGRPPRHRDLGRKSARDRDRDRDRDAQPNHEPSGRMRSGSEPPERADDTDSAAQPRVAARANPDHDSPEARRGGRGRKRRRASASSRTDSSRTDTRTPTDACTDDALARTLGTASSDDQHANSQACDSTELVLEGAREGATAAGSAAEAGGESDELTFAHVHAAAEDNTIADTGASIRGSRRRRRRRRGRGEPAVAPTGAQASDTHVAESDDQVPESIEADEAGSTGKRKSRRRRGGRRKKTESLPEHVSQDQIIIDIDESELEVVRDQFGEVNELDDLTLKGRRRGVIDQLQDEVELEDLSRDDNLDEEPTQAGADDDDDDSEDEEDDDVAAAEAEAESDDSREEKKKKRRRRRRRKKKPAAPTPELTAPPHKDFWEVWSANFSYREFEDDTFRGGTEAIEDEPPPEPRRRARAAPQRTRPARASSFGAESTSKPLVSVRLNVGRAHGKKAAHVRELLANDFGLEGRTVRNLTVKETHTEFRIAHDLHVKLDQAMLGFVFDDIELELELLANDTEELAAPPPLAPEAAADAAPDTNEAAKPEPGHPEL